MNVHVTHPYHQFVVNQTSALLPHRWQHPISHYIQSKLITSCNVVGVSWSTVKGEQNNHDMLLFADSITSSHTHICTSSFFCYKEQRRWQWLKRSQGVGVEMVDM
jgi:hypothetical protein